MKTRVLLEVWVPVMVDYEPAQKGVILAPPERCVEPLPERIDLRLDENRVACLLETALEEQIEDAIEQVRDEIIGMKKWEEEAKIEYEMERMQR